jgi:hypothetical protein
MRPIDPNPRLAARCRDGPTQTSRHAFIGQLYIGDTDPKP